jgi:hypothetical protein
MEVKALECCMDIMKEVIMIKVFVIMVMASHTVSFFVVRNNDLKSTDAKSTNTCDVSE